MLMFCFTLLNLHLCRSTRNMSSFYNFFVFVLIIRELFNSKILLGQLTNWHHTSHPLQEYLLFWTLPCCGPEAAGVYPPGIWQRGRGDEEKASVGSPPPPPPSPPFPPPPPPPLPKLCGAKAGGTLGTDQR